MREGLRYRMGRLGDECMKLEPDTIKSLIGPGEGYNPVFKESFSNGIAREICAFANADGGKVLLGVSDGGEARGITISNMDPLLNIQIHILSAVGKKIEAEENKKIALDELLRSILHNLMTAKIRANHPEAIP